MSDDERKRVTITTRAQKIEAEKAKSAKPKKVKEQVNADS